MLKKATIYFVFILLLLPFWSMAQPAQEMEFPASQLSDVSRNYAGSPNNWPIVRELAEYDYATNRYFISSENTAKLAVFLESWKELETHRSVYAAMSTRGGQVFASSELQTLDSLFTEHRRLINDAQIEESITLASNIVEKVLEVDELIESRRVADVEAKLEDKTGQVDQRRGLLSQWDSASIGDLFNRSDGIRTGRESLAQLVFVDGSDVVLYENTTAVIRQSRVDQLTNRSEVEIELSGGGMLTRLTPGARNDSDYRLVAGTSTSEIRSGNFWAEADQQERILMSNFDGEVFVGGSESQVLLRQNEGTIVLRGQEPSAPIRLLAAPTLNFVNPDTVLYSDEVRLTWSEVDNAAIYEVETSVVRSFDRDVRTFRADGTSTVVTGLREGINYVHVRAYDENGLRGNNSSLLRVLRIVSDLPPPVILDTRRQQIVYTFEPEFSLSGTTEPGVQLQINNEAVRVDRSGRFSKEITVRDEEIITVRAVNNAGISREIVQTIRYVDQDALFNMRWSVPVDGDNVRKASVISVSGQAHSFMNVTLVTSDTEIVTPVGTGGNWARQIRTGDSDFLTIRFTDRETGAVIAERTYNLN